MKLIVGLGNPGREYEHSRHNTGFDVLEILSQMTSTPIAKAQSRALIGQTSIGGDKVILARPQTFMNASGESVKPLMDFFKIPPENLLVIYDDIDIPQGSIRMRPNGSAGSHNGMKSIIYQLHSESFARLRVGVGQKPANWDLAAWVLSQYRDVKERELMFDALKSAAEAAVCWAEKGVNAAMNLYNKKQEGK
ncbi:MAG: aminoacyl-tRNA hydrolase [Eubacteriales bacterium]|nr:aminoacyl-tRNA hydrolase [Eubacteriales bacterium]MDD3882019.1 aminoacyl-tRNA hydrolase [Eubacteriales bacterium]MDD4512466.1 aminoacyl-tRNA hydrolase [Eubacteriales bacterium]